MIRLIIGILLLITSMALWNNQQTKNDKQRKIVSVILCVIGIALSVPILISLTLHGIVIVSVLVAIFFLLSTIK